MNTPQLDKIIDKARFSVLGHTALIALFRASAMMVVSFVIVVLVEAVIGFGVTGLILLDSILIVIGLLCLVMVCKTLYKNRLSTLDAAKLIEERFPVPNNRLINAVSLKEQSLNDFSESLSREAIARGEAIAGTLDMPGLIPTGRLRRDVLILSGCLLFAVLIYVFFPRMFHATLPRLLHPVSDLPPYNRLAFDVQVLPTDIALHNSVTVRARIHHLPEWIRADITLDRPTVPRQTYPMIRVMRNQTETRKTGVLYEFTLNRVDSPLRFHINTPIGRSAWHLISPDTTPKLAYVEVEYSYPDYTSYPVRVAPLTAKGISAIKGTHVRIHVASNVPLQTGQLLLYRADPDHTPSQVVTLNPDPADPSHAYTTIRLDEQTHYDLSLIGRDGRTAPNILSGPIHVMEDRPPAVTILEPVSGSIVDPEDDIPIRILTEDDMGIRSAQLSIQINNQEPWAIELMPYVLPEAGTHTLNRFDVPLTMSPSRLGAEAGDTIRLSVTVRDNHPDPTHRITTSPHLIRIGNPNTGSNASHTADSPDNSSSGRSSEDDTRRSGSVGAGEGKVSTPAQQSSRTPSFLSPIEGLPIRPTIRLEVVGIPDDAIRPRQGLIPPDTPELYREQAAAYFRRIAEDWMSQDY